MNRNLRRAIQIATQTRYWIDRNFKYMLDKEALPITRDLCGACAIASYILYRKLKQSKIKHIELCYTPVHVFVRVSNYLIDITASQFPLKQYKNQKVVLLNWQERLNSPISAYNEWYRYKIHSPNKFKLKQRFSTWDNTSPFYKKLKGFINMGIKGIDY